MKKLVYMLIVAASASLIISSCAEDNLQPIDPLYNYPGGGGASEPIRID